MDPIRPERSVETVPIQPIQSKFINLKMECGCRFPLDIWDYLNASMDFQNSNVIELHSKKGVFQFLFLRLDSHAHDVYF